MNLSGITHQCVLGLFDKEGLSILSQLHVQAHWLSINFNVHLHGKDKSFDTPQKPRHIGDLVSLFSSVTAP